jgi:hypothetical protein
VIWNKPDGLSVSFPVKGSLVKKKTVKIVFNFQRLS